MSAVSGIVAAGTTVRDASPARHLTEARAYAVFGGVLASALEFPELIEAATRGADWTLDVVAGPVPEVECTVLGARQVRQETYVLYRTDSGYRLTYSHAGAFDLSADGGSIVWYPSHDARLELGRAIVLGPVLALALELSGHVCLHGSAIEVVSRGVAFIAPKHHGKSTLASALVRAGAGFIGDDTLAVSLAEVPMLRPGTGSVRLWDDAAEELGIDALCRSVVRGVKTTATGFLGSAGQVTTVPLEAVYILESVPPDETDTPAERARLAPSAGAIALAQHAKLPDALVGYAAAGRRLAGAASLAARVPVYSLRIARSFALLPAAVECIMRWHSDPGTVDA